MFCLAGFQIGNWISPSKEDKNVKIFPPTKTECKGGICPEPEINEVSEELIKNSMKLLRESDNGDIKNLKERR
jgi:hypothetical protein